MVDRILKFSKSGFSIRNIAKQVGLATGTVHKTLSKNAPKNAEI